MTVAIAGTSKTENDKIHISCSQPIKPGDDFGSLQVVSFTSKDGGPVATGGVNVDYTYKVTNTGATTIENVMVTDSELGAIGTIPSLAPGGMATLMKSTTVEDTVTNTATASANVQGAQTATCEDKAQATVMKKPPPPIPFVCSDNKPLNGLTMIWDGSVDIRIKAWKGAVNSTLLADIDNIMPGDEVTVTNYAGAPNDVIWEIFAAGTSTKLGQSTFHLSCSDADMNGPEDCGKDQGNGKGLPGFINTWILEEIEGSKTTLDCTP
jgi:hypothetical protein